MEGEQEAEKVVISEGVVKEVSQFKYLGSVLVADGKLDVELNIRKGSAYGRFNAFKKLWGSKHLSVSTKVKCYRAYVLPILLFGSETWALSKEQSLMLERVHTSCLRLRLRLQHGPSKGAPVRSQPRLHGQKYWNLVHQK